MLIFCKPDFKAIFAKRTRKKEDQKNISRISVENIKETVFDYTEKGLFVKSAFAKSGGLFRKSFICKKWRFYKVFFVKRRIPNCALL